MVWKVNQHLIRIFSYYYPNSEFTHWNTLSKKLGFIPLSLIIITIITGYFQTHYFYFLPKLIHFHSNSFTSNFTSLFLFLFFNTLTFLLSWSLLLCTILHPGPPHHSNHNSSSNNTFIVNQHGIIQSKFCTICNRSKPIRTHHCKQCNQCIHKLDHHCIIINNCIGEYTLKFFLLFLMYSFLASVFASIVNFIPICTFIFGSVSLHSLTHFKSIHIKSNQFDIKLVCTLILIVFGYFLVLIQTINVFVLSVITWYNAIHGVTTLETFYIDWRTRFRDYDYGWKHNLKCIFGEHSTFLITILPIHSKSSTERTPSMLRV
mmetsp:Transcript_1337/g.2441  ORF Transcript_1337/g.2441 Transcript_1337/m.2441 type:complete len:318 (+) Transcript_1337:12-965(+)